jgi:hypothetical protein
VRFNGSIEVKHLRILPSAKWSKKVTAASVTAAFFFTTVGEPFAQTSFWAERQAARSRTSPSSGQGDAQHLLAGLSWPKESLNPILGAYRLPSTLGTVVETRAADPDAPVLIHLQDAHGVYGAQYNASQILDGLSRAGWSGAEALPVYQEGGVGPANIDWLSAFPDNEIKEQVGHAHLRHGDMTGEEYRAIVASSGTFRLVGVETEDLYKRNLAARHETAKDRAQADVQIGEIQRRLDGLKAEIYPVPLLAIDRPLQAYTAQTISFIEYIQTLAVLAPRSLDPLDFPNLTALLQLTKLEAELNLRNLAEERDLLVRKMANQLTLDEVKSLVAKAADVREGRLTQGDFYRALLGVADQLKRQGQDLPTRELRNYVAYLKLADSLNHRDLLTESDQLRARLLDKYSDSDRVWRLVNLDRRVALERLLWKQEMTPDQYAAFKVLGPLDWAEVAKYLAEQEGQKLEEVSFPTLTWTRSLPQVRAFYELAVERDMALATNALVDMKRTGVKRAVLIAGGFHTPGLTRLFRQQGVSYAVVQPSFDDGKPRLTPNDLIISQSPQGLTPSAREANQFVTPPLGTAGAENPTSQFALKISAMSAIKALSLPKRSVETYLAKVRFWMANSAKETDVQITGIFEVGGMIVVFGRLGENPEPVAFFFREREGESGIPSMAFKVGAKEVLPNNALDLSNRLPSGFVNPGGLSAWTAHMLRNLSASANSGKLGELHQEAMKSLKEYGYTSSKLLLDLSKTGDETYFLEESREGQQVVEALKKAAQISVEQAPAKAKGFFTRLVEPKSLAVGGILATLMGFAGATEIVGVASSAGAGFWAGLATTSAPLIFSQIFPVVVVLSAFTLLVIKYVQTQKAVLVLIPGDKISTPKTIDVSSSQKSLFPLLAGLAVSGLIFTTGVPFLTELLNFSTMAGLLAPVILVLNITSGISFLMVALVVGYKVYFTPDYKDHKWVQEAKLLAPLMGLLFTSGVLSVFLLTLAVLNIPEEHIPFLKKQIQWAKSTFASTKGSVSNVLGASEKESRLHRWILFLPRGAVHLTKDLAGTFKNFAFSSALDLYAIYDGSSTKNPNALSSAERGFILTLNKLRGDSQPSSIRRGVADAVGLVALVFFYTQGTVASRLRLLVISSFATLVGQQAVGLFVSAAYLGGGGGAVVLAVFFIWQAIHFQRSYEGKTGFSTRAVVFYTLAAVALLVGGFAFMGMDQTTLLGNFFGFNPAELFGVNVQELTFAAQMDPTDHWLQLKGATVQAMAPVAWLGSVMLGLFMAIQGMAKNSQLQKAEIDKKDLSFSARLLGWIFHVPKTVAGLWGAKLEQRVAFEKQSRSSIFGLMMVGIEVAAAVYVAAWMAALNIGLGPVTTVVTRIEDTRGLSIMSLAGEVTKTVGVALIGEEINLHNYKIVGTDYTQQQLVQLAQMDKQIGDVEKEINTQRERLASDAGSVQRVQGLETLLNGLKERREQIRSNQIAAPPPPAKNENGFIGLIPMLLGISSSHADELTETDRAGAVPPEEEAKVPPEAEEPTETPSSPMTAVGETKYPNVSSGPPISGESPAKDPFYFSIEKALELSGHSSGARVAKLDAMSAQKFVEELRDNYFTVSLQFAARQLKEGKTVPGPMVDVLRSVGWGDRGGTVDYFEGVTKGPDRVTKKNVTEVQTDLVMNALIWDTDAKKSEKVRAIAAEMRNIMAEIKEKDEIPRLIMDLFLDIRGANERITAIDGALENLESGKPLVLEKVRALVENPERVKLNISDLKRELKSERHKIVGERESAVVKLKGVIPGFFPPGATIDEIQDNGFFDVDPNRLEEYLKKAGSDKASVRRIDLANKKVEMLKAAIPAGENFRLAADLAVILMKTVAGKAFGGVGMALGVAAGWTISDPVRESMQSAGVWAYAQAVVEAEAVAEQERVAGHIARKQSATQQKIVGINRVSLERGKGSLDQIQQRLIDGTTPLRDYLTSLKSVTESKLQMQSRLREQDRWKAVAVEYSQNLGLTLLRDSNATPIDRLIQEANSGTFFGGPNKQLQEKIRGLSVVDARAMEPVHFGDDPNYEKLSGMMLGRSYPLRQARYLVAQREAELEAVARVGDLKWAAYGGFYTSGQSGKALSQTLADRIELRAGVTVSKTFDFAETLRIKEFSLQVDAANLNAQEQTNRALRDLGLKLQLLETALARREMLTKTIEKTEKMVALDERGRTTLNLNQPSQTEQNLKALAQARADLIENEQVIHDAEIKINQDIGKSDKDTGEFTSKFRARNIHRTLPFLRFEGYIERTRQGDAVTDVLNKEGQKLLEETGKEIESARALLAGMKEFVKTQSESGGRASNVDPRIVEILEIKLEEFSQARERAVNNSGRAPKEVYKDLNDLSEKALALVVFKTALSPEVKLKTPEGLKLDEFVTNWDKHFRGRFDAFSSQRIALKNAEINQVRAVIAGETEPITINLDVLSFTAGKSGSALTALGKSNLANILSVAIPPRLWEVVGRSLHPLGDAAGKGTFGQVIANLIPGYQSSKLREKSIATLLLLAQNELLIADQRNFDVQSNRESFNEQLKLARYIRTKLFERVESRGQRVPSVVPRFTTQVAETANDIEDLKTIQEYLDIEKRVADLEIALLSLGVDTKDLPETAVDGQTPDPIGLSFGGKFADQTFEVQIARLRIKLAELELEAAKIGLGIPRIPVSVVARKGTDGKVEAGWIGQLSSKSSVGLSPEVDVKIAQLDKARLIESQTNRDQAVRLQDDYKSLVLSGVYIEMARDLHHRALHRMEVLAAAKKIGSEEYNTLNRLTLQISKIWDNGGAGLEDAVYRIQIALGLTPTKLPTLNYAEARQKMRATLGSGLGNSFGGGANFSIHDPAAVTAAKVVMQRLPATDELVSVWTPLLEANPTSGRVPAVPEVPGLNEHRSRLSGEKLRNLVIPVVDLSLFPGAKSGPNAEVRFSWTLFGGGGKAREEIIGLGLEKEQELLTQKVQSYQDTLDQNRREIKRSLIRLDEVNNEIQELTQGPLAKKLHKDFVNDQIQVGDVGSYQNQLIGLFAERADLILTMALRYQSSRDLLGAFGIEIPLLEDQLDKAGVRRLPNGQRSLFNEMENPGGLLDSKLMSPANVPETPEWDMAARTPVRLHKPVDGRVDQNPERTASVYVDAFGERWKAPNTHLTYSGPAWFQAETDGLAADIGMTLGGPRILDRNDWASFLRDLMVRYRMPVTPEFMANFRVAWQRVNREFKGYTDPSEMPNSFSKYSENSFKQRFPHFGPMTADYETNLRLDKNFHNKLGLALYYANQVSIHGPDWLDKTFSDDAAFIHLMNKERNRGETLTEAEKSKLLEWKKQHSSEMDLIFYRQIPETEKEAINRAAQAGLRRMFPELARWSDRLKREGKPGRDGQAVDPRVQGFISRFGDLDLESLYSSMAAMAISNGWNAETLTNYLNFLSDQIMPQVGRYSQIATLRDHAQQPDADRLRFLLGGYQHRKAEVGAVGLHPEDYAIYKDVIDAERTRMEMVYLLSTSMNKADAYFFALHKTADQVLDTPALRKKVTDHFPQAMDRVLALRDMPEVRKLILSQTRPAGGRIFWTQSDVQGILDALAQGWEASVRQAKIDGARYGATRPPRPC